ncbi:GNAT family acetyltransferase [Oceanobacillus sp. CAU 1775]
MQLEIRDFSLDDREQVKHLIQLNNEEDYLLHIIERNEGEAVQTVFIGTELIGVSFTWKSNFHPNCTYFRILVDPFYRDEAIAEILLENLEKQTVDYLPLQTSLWETSTYLMETLENNKFEIIRKTYMPQLDLSKIKNHATEKENTYKIFTIEEAAKDRRLVENLVELVKTNYKNTHLVNPVADLELNEWEQMIFAEDMISQLSCVFTENEEIIAYSFLHESEDKDALELGWCGAKFIEEKKSESQLILHQIQQAKQLGYRIIIGEFDTTDQPAMEILKSFPFQQTPTWLTMQKRK